MQEFQGLGHDPGPVVMPTKQGIYESSPTQQTNLGQRIMVGDRVFRYAGIGNATIAAGQILGAVSAVANAVNRPVQAAAIQGATKVLVALGGAVVANLYAEGYMVVNNGVGQGLIYRVRSHPAIASAGNVWFTLYDGLQVALDTTSRVSFKANIFKDVLAKPAAVGRLEVGVAPIAVGVNEFFWAQTWGPVSVQNAGNISEGVPICSSATVIGVVEAWTGTSNRRILGQMLTAGIATERRMAFLTIMP